MSSPRISTGGNGAVTSSPRRYWDLAALRRAAVASEHPGATLESFFTSTSAFYEAVEATPSTNVGVDIRRTFDLVRREVGALRRASSPALGLEERLANIEKRLDTLQATVGEPQPDYVARDVSLDVAKEAIKEFLDARPGEDIYPDEIAEALQLDFIQVVKACEALVAEKHIGRAKP